MRNWWTIAKLELTLALRDREAVVWSLVAPVAMAAIFGAMFGGNDPPSPTKVTIQAGANPPAVSAAIKSQLERRGMVVGDDGIRVALPDSLVGRLHDGRGVTARIVKKDEGDTRVMSVSAATREALYALAFSTPDTASAAGLVLHSEHPLVVQTSTLGQPPEVISGAERMLPSMLVMFVMFQLTTFFMLLWVDDLKTGKTKRITMSPTPTSDIVLGNVIARLLWAAFQVAVILGVGSLVLRVRLDVNWGHFIVLLAVYMLAATALGLLLGTFFKTVEKANATGVIVGLMLAALGGCWWPLEIVPGFMRMVALALPTGQAMDAIGEMTALGPSAPFPMRSVIVLGAMAVILLPIAARRMRVQLTA